MAKIEDVIRELIKKTKNGDLKWIPWDDLKTWTVEYNNCIFLVYLMQESIKIVMNGRSGQSLSIGGGSAIYPLIRVLGQMYPFKKKATKKDAVQIAYECLTT